jgi:FkbH-like protein
VRFIARLNAGIAEWARTHSSFYVHDLNHLAAWVGLRHWHDRRLWHMAKYCCAYEAIPYLAQSMASLVKAIYGKGKKVLVLDMDNTLWGGVIGDDGVDGIQIGQENPEAEAFTELQKYARDLKARGIVLAVASKNEDTNARLGLSHPDSILREADFAAFRANWDPKHENIRSIGHALNLGLDSFVFLDDNPAERALVAGQLPEVAVPEAGDDPTRYPGILDRSGWFEVVALSQDDLKRAGMYEDNAKRDKALGQSADYGAFLASLEMEAEIDAFAPLYLDRITQLTNKSNQFNLTTRRYTLAEMEQVAADPSRLGLYGRLKDRFGDNGLVSVVIGRQEALVMHLELWLMSCRVLKRGMEDAMLDALAQRALARGAATLMGYYHPTAKNAMVRDFYGQIGFERISPEGAADSVWRLELAGYKPRSRAIRVIGRTQA